MWEKIATRCLLFLGTCLALWLCSLLGERLLRAVAKMSTDLMRQAMLAAGVLPADAPPVPMPTVLPATEAVPDDSVLVDLDAPSLLEKRIPWAVGMSAEDLRTGIDPLTGRPLTW